MKFLRTASWSRFSAKLRIVAGFEKFHAAKLLFGVMSLSDPIPQIAESYTVGVLTASTGTSCS